MGAGRPDWAENTADDLFIYLIYLITQDRLLKSISQSVALWSEAAQKYRRSSMTASVYE